MTYFCLLDINECEEIPPVCGASSTCTNTDGSYTCTCVTGFEMVDGSCIGMFLVFKFFFINVLDYLIYNYDFSHTCRCNVGVMAVNC